MNKKDKSQLRLSIMSVLYYVEKTTEQEKMITILLKYNAKFPDSRLKDVWDKIMLSTKKDYYDKVDYLLKDMFEGSFGSDEKKIIQEMLAEIQPIFEQANRTLWQQFVDLFSWS